MTVNSAVNIMAGFFIMVSLALAHFMEQIDITQMSWLWVTAFVGFNLFQSGFTGICPAKSIFKALGMKENKDKNCCS